MRREGAPAKPIEPEKARWGWGSDKLWWMKEVVELTWAKRFGKTRGLVVDDDDEGGEGPADPASRKKVRPANSKEEADAGENEEDLKAVWGSMPEGESSDYEGPETGQGE